MLPLSLGRGEELWDNNINGRVKDIVEQYTDFPCAASVPAAMMAMPMAWMLAPFEEVGPSQGEGRHL